MLELMLLLKSNLLFSFIFFINILCKNNMYFFSNMNYIFMLLIMFWFLLFYLKLLINSNKMSQLINFNLVVCLLFFITKNFMVFYIMFEFSIIPILMMISFWGYQIERIQASSFLLGYTLCFSIPSIFIFYIFQMNFYSMENFIYLKINMIYLIWIFSMFLVKLPLFMFHIWLPKAHVEAPTVGSILLAAILLKLGAFGIMKMMFFFNLKIILESLFFFSFLGSIFSCFLCFLQTDMKALIAYSSVVHMNFLLMGLLIKYSFVFMNLIIIIIFHAFVSSMMFFKAGFIFNNFKTRKIYFVNLTSFPNKMILMILILILILNFNPPPSLGVFPEMFFILNFFNKNYYFIFFIIFFGLMSAFFCIFLILNLMNGKNNFYKNFNNSINNNFMNLFCSLIVLNFLMMLFFY